MRIDRFLNAVNITKSRSIAEDMCKSSVISINGTIAKASKEIKIGDIINIKYQKYDKNYQILSIPSTKTTSKSLQSQFVKEL